MAADTIPDSPTDDFINVWADPSDEHEFHRQWSNQASAKHSAPPLQAANALRKIYPDHSLVLTFQNVRNFPGALFSPIPNAPLVTSVSFIPGARSNGSATGTLVDVIQFGAFQTAWDVRTQTSLYAGAHSYPEI
jgi:hypothetical protein